MSRYVKACSGPVHEVFDKRHGHVLRDIREAIETIERVNKDSDSRGQLKFEPSYFILRAMKTKMF